MTACSRILLALLAWGSLSFGAVYPWAYWPLVLGCAGAGIWLIVATRAWRESRPRHVAAALGAIALALVVQLVPLPYDWFMQASPSGDAVLSQLHVGWALVRPSSHTLSLAPSGTLTALALFVAFSLLIVGLMRGAGHLPLEWMAQQLTVFGLAMATLAIVQRVIYGPGDIPVYGFWRASEYATPFGPFINRNHFAGWMVMVVPVALAVATARIRDAREKHAGRFVFDVTAILIMTLAVVLSGSRSGMVSIVVSLAALGWFASRQPRERQGGSPRALPAMYLLLFVVVAVGWAGAERTVARFGDARTELLERFAAWQDTARIARDFPLAGTGFGAYGTVMLVYQTAGRHAIYAQAHNDYLQVLAEGGLLAGVPVLIAVVVIVSNIRHRFSRTEPPGAYWIRAGSAAGLLGIAAQSLLDFSLQMPGNAMMCAVLIAIALHRPSSHHARRV